MLLNSCLLKKAYNVWIIKNNHFKKKKQYTLICRMPDLNHTLNLSHSDFFLAFMIDVFFFVILCLDAVSYVLYIWDYTRVPNNLWFAVFQLCAVARNATPYFESICLSATCILTDWFFCADALKGRWRREASALDGVWGQLLGRRAGWICQGRLRWAVQHSTWADALLPSLTLILLSTDCPLVEQNVSKG